jgi:hypothetical protein
MRITKLRINDRRINKQRICFGDADFFGDLNVFCFKSFSSG